MKTAFFHPHITLKSSPFFNTSVQALIFKDCYFIVGAAIEKKFDNIFALLFSHFFWLGHFEDIFGQYFKNQNFQKKKNF